ncbi:MAG TPA: phosphopantetheine-binding protein [Noviherbaspirillum sp.]
MDMLELEIKKLIIESLNLEDLTPDDIDSQGELFGDGLGLDSIDALELGIVLTKKYGIALEAGDSRTREYFRSVASLAELVRSHADINRKEASA